MSMARTETGHDDEAHRRAAYEELSLGPFWLIPIVVVLLAGTWALIRLSVERTRRRDLIARAEYEDDLWASIPYAVVPIHVQSA